MGTPSAWAGHPREDRLERLLRTGDGVPSGADDAAVHDGAPEDEPDHTEGGWVPGVAGHAGGATLEGLDDRPARGRHRSAGVPVLNVPESLRSAELRVGVRAVRGLLLLVVVAALVLGGRWLWTQRTVIASPTDRVVRSEDAGHARGAGQDPPSAAETASGDLEPGVGSPEQGEGDGGQGEPVVPDTEGRSTDLLVHVAGQVHEPGVVTVPAGSRVVDAVRAAGGVTDEADETTLNLARPLLDGERVWVGRPGEVPPVAPAPGTGTTGGAGGSGAAAQATLLDLNTATQADLEELPGVGPVTAGHILGWRDEHGRFSRVDELLEVSGIGERTLAQLEPLVTVGG